MNKIKIKNKNIMKITELKITMLYIADHNNIIISN